MANVSNAELDALGLGSMATTPIAKPTHHAAPSGLEPEDLEDYHPSEIEYREISSGIWNKGFLVFVLTSTLIFLSLVFGMTSLFWHAWSYKISGGAGIIGSILGCILSLILVIGMKEYFILRVAPQHVVMALSMISKRYYLFREGDNFVPPWYDTDEAGYTLDLQKGEELSCRDKNGKMPSCFTADSVEVYFDVGFLEKPLENQLGRYLKYTPEARQNWLRRIVIMRTADAIGKHKFTDINKERGMISTEVSKIFGGDNQTTKIERILASWVSSPTLDAIEPVNKKLAEALEGEIVANIADKAMQGFKDKGMTPDRAGYLAGSIVGRVNPQIIVIDAPSTLQVLGDALVSQNLNKPQGDKKK